MHFFRLGYNSIMDMSIKNSLSECNFRKIWRSESRTLLRGVNVCLFYLLHLLFSMGGIWCNVLFIQDFRIFASFVKIGAGKKM